MHKGERKLIIFNKSHSIQNQTDYVGVLTHRTKYEVRRAIVCEKDQHPLSYGPRPDKKYRTFFLFLILVRLSSRT